MFFRQFECQHYQNNEMVARQRKIMELKVTAKRRCSCRFLTVCRNKRIRLKAFHGRGRKPAQWVVDLYHDLRQEFERLRAVGVKLNTSLLLAQDKRLVSEADVGCSYYSQNRINGKLIYFHLHIRWIKSFMSAI